MVGSIRRRAIASKASRRRSLQPIDVKDDMELFLNRGSWNSRPLELPTWKFVPLADTGREMGVECLVMVIEQLPVLPEAGIRDLGIR
jgi:hypothetical protein